MDAGRATDRTIQTKCHHTTFQFKDSFENENSNEIRWPAVNFVRVNHYLEPSHTPLPIIINEVKGHKIYCEVDASSYFSQLLLHEDSRYITAYIDPTTGEIREFRSLPQGL